jgi:tetratricopeptide (TPR) repeat protein
MSILNPDIETMDRNELLDLQMERLQIVSSVWANKMKVVGGLLPIVDPMYDTRDISDIYIELAKKLEESSTMAWSYCRLAPVLMGKGDFKRGIEYAERALKISLDNNYAENAILAYINLYAVLPVEESEKRLDCLEKAFDLARKAGIVASISRVGSILSWTYSLMGDTEKALRLAEESAATEAEPAEEQERKPNPKIERRFSEITKQREAARQEAERERQARIDLENKLKEMEAKLNPVPQEKVEADPKPKPEQFSDMYEYAEALAEWTADKKIKEERIPAAEIKKARDYLKGKAPFSLSLRS